mmetsp:Transcript_18170/g.43730  ORF Transcript_18170/g.43730 Transcript_18170/m.43730 type:complete len:230 (-) Transcript_18170:1165-1854(-)
MIPTVWVPSSSSTRVRMMMRGAGPPRRCQGSSSRQGWRRSTPLSALTQRLGSPAGRRWRVLASYRKVVITVSVVCSKKTGDPSASVPGCIALLSDESNTRIPPDTASATNFMESISRHGETTPKLVMQRFTSKPTMICPVVASVIWVLTTGSATVGESCSRSLTAWRAASTIRALYLLSRSLSFAARSSSSAMVLYRFSISAVYSLTRSSISSDGGPSRPTRRDTCQRK